MLTIQELKELQERLQKGKAIIDKIPNGWAGGTYPPFDAKDRYGRNMKKYKHHKTICKVEKEETCGLTMIQRALCKWWTIDRVFWDNYQKHAVLQTTEQKEVKHSRAWNIMKQQQAIEKWKHTLKAKRGTDPRTQILETFT